MNMQSNYSGFVRLERAISSGALDTNDPVFAPADSAQHSAHASATISLLPSAVNVSVITSDAALLALEPEWRALEPRMPSLPFVSVDWVLAWLNHFRSNRSSIRDELYCLVFRASCGMLLGVAPLILTSRPSKGPLRLRQLQLIGADPNLTELRCIAAPTEHMEVVWAAMVDHLRAAKLPCDWMRLTSIDSPRTFENIQQKFGRALWSREVSNFIVPLKPTWEEFKSGLSRNIKESLRKCYNAPKRDGIEYEFVAITEGPALDEAIEHLVRLHGIRSELTDTVAHPNVFQTEESRKFMVEVCHRFAARNCLRAFQLKHQGKVIATRFAFICNESMYLFYSGYEPDYGKYSVMTTTVAEAIQYAIANGLQSINLSVGRDVSKERWKPEEKIYYDLEVIYRPGLASLKYKLFKTASGGLKNSWLGKLVARNR